MTSRGMLKAFLYIYNFSFSKNSKSFKNLYLHAVTFTFIAAKEVSAMRIVKTRSSHILYQPKIVN